MTAVPLSRPRPVLRWRVVDIVVAAVFAVAGGVVFWAWNIGYQVPSAALEAAVPGLGALTGGLWMMPGVLAGLVIRKPGAALFVEIVAAFVSMLIGAQWGADTLLSGLFQGIGAELAFAILLYRRFGIAVAVLSGALAALAEVPHELIVYYPGVSASYVAVFVVALTLSGAVLAGVLGWVLARGLAATGVLSRFAAGRERRAEV
ncbi:ECF transporter S component [Pseudolysinimonas sp.]|uniref:ECF transporter S component n=1 Tax=Pseudolysinimonas sp. TaxID=2680009 RepID=UPI003F7D93D1